jgi:hypothetical protein
LLQIFLVMPWYGLFLCRAIGELLDLNTYFPLTKHQCINSLISTESIGESLTMLLA